MKAAVGDSLIEKNGTSDSPMLRYPCRDHRYLGMLVLATALCTPAGAQTLSETILGNIASQKPLLVNRNVVSRQGDNIAIHERIMGKERYVTLQGPSETFDQISPGAVWIDDRLVYFGVQGDKRFLIDGQKKILLTGKPTSPPVSGRPWPSQNRTHYIAFISDSKNIEWYLDGIKQDTRFDRLENPPIKPPGSVPIFVATKNCLSRVIGHESSAKARWDKVKWVTANDDGSVMFVYGERAGLPILHRNGIQVLNETVTSFATSRDGKQWVAIIDRSREGEPRAILIENGKKALEMPVDEPRHKLYFAGNGSTWVWKITDEDDSGVTIKQRGKPDRRLSSNPLEYYLSEDGVREAYANQTTEIPAGVKFTVDGNLLPVIAPDITPNSFNFGPGQAFAFEARDDKAKWIISHLGEGPKFEAVSKVLFLPDGRPVYTAMRSGERIVLVGTAEIKIPADDLYNETLRLQGSTVRILGARGTSIVDLSIANN